MSYCIGNEKQVNLLAIALISDFLAQKLSMCNMKSQRSTLAEIGASPPPMALKYYQILLIKISRGNDREEDI